MAYVDFSALKERVPIADALSHLDLKLLQRGDQFRGRCPACNSGGDRALVVTPAKQAFYCFAGGTGGDVIALAAHIRGTDMKTAAEFLHSQLGNPNDNQDLNSSPEETVRGDDQDVRVLKPLTYLKADHDRVRALGLDADTCAEFGAGYAPKGILRGRLAIPIHDWRSSNLIAYSGYTVRGETPKFAFPKGFDPAGHIFNGHQANEGETVLMHDPLEVMLAHQNGITGGISFLTESTSAKQFQMLAAMMEEKGIATLEIA